MFIPQKEYYKLIDTIKERLDIVEIISEYVDLKKIWFQLLGNMPLSQ